MKIPSQITKNGITLTLDFVSEGEVFYKKHYEKPDNEPVSLLSDWNRFIGLFRIPIADWMSHDA